MRQHVEFWFVAYLAKTPYGSFGKYVKHVEGNARFGTKETQNTQGGLMPVVAILVSDQRSHDCGSKPCSRFIR